MLDETGGPNVGPFFCGGLITRNRVDGSLSYSGQYQAFRHFSRITPNARIYPLTFRRIEKTMFDFPQKNLYYTEGVLVEGTDGQTTVILVNPNEKKEQLQLTYNGKSYYIEMLPDTVTTICLE